MEPVHFSARQNIFEKGERLWIADAQGLSEVWPGGQSRFLPWQALRGVVAGHAPSRFKPDRYTVKFIFRHKGRGQSVMVENMHFEGVGRFSQRSAAYAGFVRAALAFAHSARPDAVYRGGTGTLSYGVQIALTAVTLLLVGYVLVFFGLGGFAVWVRLVLIGVLTLLIVRWAIRARPAPMDPRNVDARFLPAH